jgi:nitrogen fixation protein FixH
MDWLGKQFWAYKAHMLDISNYLFFGMTLLNHLLVLTTIHFMLELAMETWMGLVYKSWYSQHQDFYHQPKRYPDYTKPK